MAKLARPRCLLSASGFREGYGRARAWVLSWRQSGSLVVKWGYVRNRGGVGGAAWQLVGEAVR